MLIGLGLGLSGGSMTMAWIGVALFATTTVFTLITLPVEFDASRRALATLETSGVLVGEEIDGARSVLNAAAMTYVAAAAVSLMQLLYWVFRILGAQRSND
jgi:Zn-dependent membrane protease YugP